MVYIFAYDMFIFQVRDEKKVQLLSRSLSGFHMRAFVSPISSIVCLPLCLPCLLFCGNFRLYISLFLLDSLWMWLDIVSSFCDMDWPAYMVKSYQWC